MSFAESALTFPCAGETLVGVLAQPATPRATAIVIAVGGPQYRAGSHRQFTLLARRLAAAGYPVLRFDYRGMGDSTGDAVPFTATGPDIGAAVDALCRAAPGTTRVVLWGLCDAASAALLYLDAGADPRIGGLCLLNPWVRSETSLARTQVKHYYGQRLISRDFWLKLIRGRLDVAGASREFLGKLAKAARRPPGAAAGPELPFPARMARAWRAFAGDTLLILSGDDYTAKEFADHARSAPDWAGLAETPRVTRIDLAGADHTFSSAARRNQVEQACLAWLAATDPVAPSPSAHPETVRHA